MNDYKKTIFLDIDGTLFKHQGDLFKMHNYEMEVLPGVIEKLNEWDSKGHKIILTTARKECFRKKTEEQLLNSGIFYDQLVMGLTRGERIIINDIKPDSRMVVASAIQINRDEGLSDINLD